MKRTRKESKKNTKFIIIAIGLAVVLIASLAATIGIPSNPNVQEEKEEKQLASYVINSRYIKEFEAPENSEPVAINVNNGIVWFADSKERRIIKFDPSTQEFEEFPLPSNARSNIISIWSLVFDKDGNLWFQDAGANSIWRFYINEQRFEQYIIPTLPEGFGTSYPINIVFVNDKVWFSEIYGKKIGVLDPLKVKDKSSEGITEIEVASDLETLGPLSVDKDNNIWFTALTFPIKGELFKLDPDTLEFTKYDLPKNIASPVGIAIDDNNRLWINDHGTSSIIIFDPVNNVTSSIVTSMPIKETSPYLYEECIATNNIEECGGLRASLPYWNIIVDDKLWFNEHYGNALAVLDIDDLTLIEYIIPTMNPNYARCEGYEPCGIANVLQFDIEGDKVWFTEWSEGKIGVLDASIDIPISLEIDEPITLIRGSNTPVNIRINADEPLEAEMRVSATTSPFGTLRNLTASFDERIVKFEDKGSKDITLNILADPNLEASDYMLTITAKLDDIMVAKIVKARVI
ncbi:MAG: hypothetical protein KatS3mg003_1233 [Candidatus Nitrosocaldaceae archaeon]|nr:MAG: hypothetical protein KatS3mg003_1233 [Candidatus Nitrosocaldaceae archaeon]